MKESDGLVQLIPTNNPVKPTSVEIKRIVGPLSVNYAGEDEKFTGVRVKQIALSQ